MDHLCCFDCMPRLMFMSYLRFEGLSISLKVGASCFLQLLVLTHGLPTTEFFCACTPECRLCMSPSVRPSLPLVYEAQSVNRNAALMWFSVRRPQ